MGTITNDQNILEHLLRTTCRDGSFSVNGAALQYNNIGLRLITRL
jgi:hypothetical protein